VNTQEFWRLIGLIDTDTLNQGDEEGALEGLLAAVSQLQKSEIYAFDDALALALYDIDGHVYSQASGKAGASDDSFLYLRCYVVAMGRDFYSAVKSDPRKTPTSIENWCEPLLYVASIAWSSLTGIDRSEYDHVSPVSYETCSNKALWPDA
jgi:hypothetical protein